MNTFQIAFPSYKSKTSAVKKASCAAARLTRATPSKHISGTSWLNPFGSPQSANSFATCPNIEPASIQKTLKVHPIHPKPPKNSQRKPKKMRPKRPKTSQGGPKTTPKRPKTPPTRPKTPTQNHI